MFLAALKQRCCQGFTTSSFVDINTETNVSNKHYESVQAQGSHVNLDTTSVKKVCALRYCIYESIEHCHT